MESVGETREKEESGEIGNNKGAEEGQGGVAPKIGDCFSGSMATIDEPSWEDVWEEGN